MPIEQYREVALLLMVSIAAVNDLSSRRIPNRLLLAGLACALMLHLMSATPGASLLAALGNLGRMMFGAITPGAEAVAPGEHQSAGSMPYGVAIALGTFVVLVSHYG
jgi:Flp pilus assembly protein protease CpaA